ncbi:MAG: peptidyl-prolyl cis-trans isomerase [Okeania sp. SIO3B5]|uniref:peptidylprolyl isomerase n=1 Tax=Okeania sp. SIO3B5 TaxID=2607811 RepID=UPI0014017212|nr:peptidylprolyl isomerase [Okeania sp. SIO3B5]NEO58673.1 peptidyl-prolyl cis-trans isomerase [Okeania sp. SIO3B5]
MQETPKTLINKQETLISEIFIEGKSQPTLLIRILREPLLHFLVLGALLFGLYFWVGSPSIASTSAKQIEVSTPVIESLQATWKLQWGRKPTPQQLQKLVDNYVHDEVLYQEALALGLDDKDIIIRRRLIQKMQFLVEDVAGIKEPSDEELQSYLETHIDRYTIPGRFSFNQVYFSQELHGDDTETDAKNLLTQLQTDTVRTQPRGDRSMLPTTYTLASAKTLNNTFGGTLAREMAEVTEKGWQGPFHSAYGSHLVNVTQIEPGHPATLAEVRKNVRLDYLRDRKQKQDELFYQKLRDRYTVSINEDALNQAVQEDDA